MRQTCRHKTDKTRRQTETEINRDRQTDRQTEGQAQKEKERRRQTDRDRVADRLMRIVGQERTKKLFQPAIQNLPCDAKIFST